MAEDNKAISVTDTSAADTGTHSPPKWAVPIVGLLLALSIVLLIAGIALGASFHTAAITLSILAIVSGVITIFAGLFAARRITVVTCIWVAFIISLAAHGFQLLTRGAVGGYRYPAYILIGLACGGGLVAVWLWTEKIWRFLASKNFAVGILIILTSCVFIGTAFRPIDGSRSGFLERHGKWLYRNGVRMGLVEKDKTGPEKPAHAHGGEAKLNPTEKRLGNLAFLAAREIYFADAFHSWWFITYLGLLILACAFCTLDRWPFKLRDVGFVMTHLSLVLILFGASLYRKSGSEGTLRLSDNKDIAALSSEIYRRHLHPVPPVEADSYVEIPSNPDAYTPLDEKVRPLGFKIRAKKIWLEKHEPKFRLGARLIKNEGLEGWYPIPIRLGKTVEMFDTGWTIEFGDMYIEDDSESFQANTSLIFYEPKETQPGNSSGTKKDGHRMGEPPSMRELEKNYRLAEVIPVSPGRIINRAGYRIEVTGLWRDGGVGMKPSQDGPMADRWRRPMLRIDWTAPDGKKGHAYCFGKKFDGMPLMLELGALPFHFRFDCRLPPQSGMEITIRKNPGAVYWKGVMEVGGDPIRVCEGKLALVFGMDRPVRDYFTRVEVRDKNNSVVIPGFDIEVNRPLRYGGFSFYQSDMFPGRKFMVTGLTVKRDPGWPFVFLGFGVLWIGCGLMFFIRGHRKKSGGKNES
ncbi:MAG: hypothetical protein E3J72_13260 [Planctomycetota bacterium]|nr:MAG: hypothetical protein E3J72_13260 [Planctomycetota bacterium]